MVKKLAIAFLFVFLFVAVSMSAQTGTLTENTMVWNNLTRTYWVYVPKKVAANTSLVMVLHPTVFTVAPPTLFQVKPFEKLSDQNGFILVWPISTYNAHSKFWYWEAYFTDSSFPTPPDDIGFLGSLITNLTSQYTLDPNRIFVTGFSSGGFMAHRAGIELSAQVAAIASAEGQVELAPTKGTYTLPSPTTPVSVLTLNGDADTTVPYCGGLTRLWGLNWNIATLDQTTTYWRQSNGCTDSVPQLCTSGQPTVGVDGLDAVSCTGGVEVKAVRKIGGTHTWPAGTQITVWDFFSTHSRNGQ
ncbi:MAG TPA: PHB depolymerase family esterase [Candidatus Sulfotelmatobacter sp.]|nr:PHB depolymerase family esterase [Candidatus Sulfotelmatobacter sp.]